MKSFQSVGTFQNVDYGVCLFVCLFVLKTNAQTQCVDGRVYRDASDDRLHKGTVEAACKFQTSKCRLRFRITLVFALWRTAHMTKNGFQSIRNTQWN